MNHRRIGIIFTALAVLGLAVANAASAHPYWWPLP